MSHTPTGGPAFPAPEAGQQHFSDPSVYTGMSLRDYFAAKAMPVHMAALSTWDAGSQGAWHNEISRLSYATADAMMKARES